MPTNVDSKAFQILNYYYIQLKLLLGIDTPLDTYDRQVLENKILPFFIDSNEADKILFVGCDWYTKHYSKQFPNKEYWTIDPNPKQKKYATTNHIVDGLENLHNYFENDYFDLIICNGVFGWGLYTRDLGEKAFGDCLLCIKRGGYFVLGWNDIEELRPLARESLNS